jgi:hypothetical protein
VGQIKSSSNKGLKNKALKNQSNPQEKKIIFQATEIDQTAEYQNHKP